jgi:hypothetical protein
MPEKLVPNRNTRNSRKSRASGWLNLSGSTKLRVGSGVPVATVRNWSRRSYCDGIEFTLCAPTDVEASRKH